MIAGLFTRAQDAVAINRVVQELTWTDGNVEFPAEPKIQGADRSGVDIRVRDGGRCRGHGRGGGGGGGGGGGDGGDGDGE